MDDDFISYAPAVLVQSPCNKVCTLDRATGWCLGCGRTAREIGAWLKIDDTGRQAILDQLPERMAKLEG